MQDPKATFKPDNRRGGMLAEVIDGVSKGRFVEIPYAKQSASFAQIKKFFVNFYNDANCTDPVLHEGKKTVGLIQAAYLKQIGFYD